MKKKIISLFMALLPLFHLYAQLSGTYTVGSGGDYSTISAAVADLNLQGVGTGGVTFLVSAGHTETLSSRMNLAVTGTSSNPIVFQKSGSGANPLITAYAGGTATPSSLVPDGIWSLSGCDYVTINGIDLYDPNAANPETMEYGYGLFKASITDGCQHITISNCTVTLNKTNNASSSGPMPEGSTAILMVNSTAEAATTALPITSSSGTNSFNHFYGNTLQNCNYGLWLYGFAATSGTGPSPNPLTFLGDLDNIAGGSTLEYGNTILNFGGAPGATNPAAGIRASYQWGLTIANNTLNNNNGSGANHPSTLRGIYTHMATAASVTIQNNTISLQSGSAASACTGIENTFGSSATGSTVSILSNTLQLAYATATSGVLSGIVNSSLADQLLINDNTITQISGSGIAGTGTHLMIETGSPVNATTNNNHIHDMIRSGSSGTWHIIKTTSPDQWTCNGNTIENLSWSNVSSTGSINGIYSASSADHITANNNVIRNLSTPRTGTITGIRENGAVGNKTFMNNLIYQFFTTSGGAGGASFHGLYCSKGDIEAGNNTIYALNSTGTTGGSSGNIYGINIGGGNSCSLYSNKIFDLSSTSSNPGVAGLYFSAGTSNQAWNNLIGDIRATAANNSNAVNGIYISGGTAASLSFNTVWLNCTSTGATFGTNALYASTSVNLTLRNNILVNKSVANGSSGRTVAYRRSGTVLTSYQTGSDNNLLYAGTPGSNNLIYFDGTNPEQTLAGFQTRVSPRDASSVTEDPPFLSTTGSNSNFLHIDPSLITQIESGGQPVSGITVDYDGHTRAASPGYTGTGVLPDIGADEANFSGSDAIPPYIDFVPVANTPLLSNIEFNATLMDYSGIPVSGTLQPRIWFRLASPSSTIWASTQGTLLSGDGFQGTWKFTIDYSILGITPASGDVFEYYIVAQDVNGYTGTEPTGGVHPNVNTQTSAPPSPANYSILFSMTGTKTIGTGGDYPSLTGPGGLFAAINANPVSGNIVAEIISDLTETGANALNVWTEVAGSDYTLTIKPDSPTLRTISGTYTGGLIRVNGADRIIIDGRFSGSGSYLKFKNTYASTSYSAVFQLISSGTDAGVTDMTIRNCTIETGTTTGTSYGIYAGGSSLTTTGADHDNLSVIDNTFGIASNAISATGTQPTSAGGLDNLYISGNAVSCSTAKASIGIRVSNALNANILQNTLDIQQSAGSPGVGISLETGVNNTLVEGNLISRSEHTGGTGIGARGITVGTGLAESNITIRNNMITGVTGSNYNFLYNSSMGIVLGVIGNNSQLNIVTGGVNLYFNSVNMHNPYSNSVNCLTTAVFIGSAVSNLDMRNNIFANTMYNTGSGSGSKSFAIYSEASGISTIDYNNYFVNGSQGMLGYLGFNRATLAEWQTATGQDVSSVSGDPVFTANDNLHILPTALTPVNNSGSSIASVLTDFDGDPRSPTPDMGADEYIYTGSTVADPTDIEGFTISSYQVDIEFLPNANSNNVLIVWNLTGIFTPPLGPPPAPGQSFAGGTVLSYGISSPVSHIGMVANTFHHYKLYSHDGSDYSQGVTLMITSAGVNIPIGFNAAAMSPYDISLGWTLTAGNEIIVAVNSINSFGTPVTGNVYNANDPLAGGGTIIYRGPASSFIHTSLTPSTQYYYKAWSYNPYYSYSSGVSANAVTFCPPALLPFNEQFSGSSWPSCWKQSFSGNITSNRWAVSNSSYAGGSPYEMKAFWLNNTGTSRLISPPLNTTGVAALELSFRHFMEDYSGGATLKIQTSSDFINWNDATWFLLSGSGNAGPESIVLPITQDLGILTYIAWVIEGDHLGYDNWYIDDVYILETSCPRPYQLSAVTTTNSAVLDWEESGSATSWQVEYGPLGFTPGTASQTQVTSLPYTLTGLSPATAYDYYVTAECGAGVFSGASGPFTFITQCEMEDLPYSNSFNTASWPQCWSESHSGEIAVNLWSTSILAAAGGSPYEMYATDFDGIGTSRLISLPLNTAGQTSLQLSFNHYMDDYDIGATFKIQTSTDLLTWTDAPWSVQSGNGDIGPETVSVEITQNLGGVIYIAWVIEGDHYAYDEWYMDDVNVTGGSGTLGLDVKVWLEGPFDGTQMTTALGTGGVLPLTQPYNTPPWNYSGTESVTAIPAGVVDWVLVELRDATDPSLAGSLATLPGWPRACFLRDDGKIVDLDGTSPPDIGNPVIGNNLYVVVRHRNHIDVISAFGAILSAGQYIYDFSTSIDQAYGGGSGYKMIAPGIYGMVSGDSDGDGSAFTTDFNAWASEFGNDNLYHNADLDLDGAVFTSDFNKWAGNFGFDNPVESGWNPLYTSQVAP